MKKTLIVATRAGSLAIAQTRIVVSALQNHYPDLDIRIKKIASEGDKDRRTALWQLETIGFFTSRLENALSANEADIAVHSYKDLPIAIRQGLTIAAVFDRRFPEDCLVCASPVKSLADLPRNAKIGTSSLRRTVQLKQLRGDLQCAHIRGNVTTRLKKLESGDFDAIVLARAGLERLNLADKISIAFDPAKFIPAPAQGALAIQIRADNTEIKQIVSVLDDKHARITTTAERLVFSALQCGCHAPAGAFAKIVDNQIAISAFLSGPVGEKFARSSFSGRVSDSESLAGSLADKLLINF